jgi:integrase
MAGQIIPRGPRKWLVRVYTGSKMVEGKRKKQYVSSTVEGSYAAAERKVAELLTDVGSGDYVPPTTQSLGEYLEWWLRDVVGVRTEGGTQRSYRDRLRLVIERAGALKLDRCNTPALQRVLNQLATERKWSGRTCAYTRTILRMAFTDAIRQGILRANPASALLIPRQQAPTGTPVESESVGRVWTQEQVRHFLESTLESPWHPLWNLMLNTGLRPGEAAALRWEDLRGVDLTIQRALKQDAQAKWLIGPPKTAGSIRTITLPLSTLGVLRVLRSGQLQGDMWGALRGDVDTGVTVPTIPLLRRAFYRDVKAAGLPQIGLYGMRHTHATLLLTLGVPVKVVSERLGHTSTQITMDTYQHVLPHMQEEVAAKLNAALGG